MDQQSGMETHTVWTNSVEWRLTQYGPTVWNGDPHSMEKQSGMETHTVSAKNGSLGVVQGWDWCWLSWLWDCYLSLCHCPNQFETKLIR